jgi:outer membrane lipoprotein carrier protein
VGDGDFLWVYDLDLMQVTRVSLDQALGSSPAALLYGAEDIDSYFGLEALSSDGSLLRVRVIPYEESGLFERIEIGLTASIVRNMTLYDYFGQKTVIEFGQFSIPSNFNDDEFKFEVPDNVDLVTQ